MPARVLWRDAQGREGSLDLTGGEAIIGRAVDCAIRTDDAMVSRHHARLVAQGGQYFLEDLGSANGIFFQERRVARHPLKHGDAVRCGSLWIRYIDTGGYAQPAAPKPLAAQPAPGRPGPAGGLEPGIRSGKTAYLPPEDLHVTVDRSAPAEPRPARPATPDPLASPAREAAEAAGLSPAMHAREVQHLQRRVEQLKAELRVYRGGGDNARTYEELEEEIDNLARERGELRRRIEELENILAEDGANARVRRAGAIAKTAQDIVSGLNDVLSNLRINVMAAEGEFDQFSGALPRASFELIREALRSSATDMESARDMLRELRKIAGES